jgi:hypothetical protein
MKNFIKDKLNEAIRLGEKDEKKTEKKTDDGGGSQYQKIQGLLSNGIFNHSEIIRKLWGGDDATKRSLFRKKLNRDNNDEGSTYEFKDEELTKIVSILMATSVEIRKSVGRSGKA